MKVVYFRVHREVPVCPRSLEISALYRKLNGVYYQKSFEPFRLLLEILKDVKGVLFLYYYGQFNMR